MLHQPASRYYRLLQHIQGPSNCIFLIYLISWCFDLFITPIYLLITTWHYARVEWQIQVLTAQVPPYFPSRPTSRDGEYGRGSYRGSRIWEKKRSSVARSSLRRRGKLIVSHIKERISSSAPFKVRSRQNQQQAINVDTERDDIVYDKRQPASVPVSPTESLYSPYSDSHLSSKKESPTTAETIDGDLMVLPIQIMITPNSFDLAPLRKGFIKSPSPIEDSDADDLIVDFTRVPGSVKRECFVLVNVPSSEDEDE